MSTDGSIRGWDPAIRVEHPRTQTRPSRRQRYAPFGLAPPARLLHGSSLDDSIVANNGGFLSNRLNVEDVRHGWNERLDRLELRHDRLHRSRLRSQDELLNFPRARPLEQPEDDGSRHRGGRATGGSVRCAIPLTSSLDGQSAIPRSASPPWRCHRLPHQESSVAMSVSVAVEGIFARQQTLFAVPLSEERGCSPCASKGVFYPFP
jgi:hypothetical protein